MALSPRYDLERKLAREDLGSFGKHEKKDSSPTTQRQGFWFGGFGWFWWGGVWWWFFLLGGFVGGVFFGGFLWEETTVRARKSLPEELRAQSSLARARDAERKIVAKGDVGLSGSCQKKKLVRRKGGTPAEAQTARGGAAAEKPGTLVIQPPDSSK